MGFNHRAEPAKMKTVLLILCLSGCANAPDRYLSAEEDAQFRAQCEPAGGCAVVPMTLWQKIEILLQSLGGQRV